MAEDAVLEVGGVDFLEDFLEFAFVVTFGMGGLKLVEVFFEEGEGDALGVGEATVEVDRAEEGFEDIGEVGVPIASAVNFFAIAEDEGLAEIDAAGGLGEGGSGDDGGAEFGEEAFFEVGEALEEVVGDDEFEDGIAEEFEALVIGRGGADFAREAGVGECFLEETMILE